jgi:hypothetical protein
MFMSSHAHTATGVRQLEKVGSAAAVTQRSVLFCLLLCRVMVNAWPGQSASEPEDWPSTNPAVSSRPQMQPYVQRLPSSYYGR